MDSQLNILLIDDNEIDIVVNTKLLKLANISEQITSFMTARDLIDYINDNLSVLITKQNIILLDIQMPEIDGFQCLEMYDELPQSFKDVCKVFMLSSSIDRNDIENAEANPNVIKVLEKPLDVYLLKRLIS
ncbi:MAG: response regulator [Flavobacteriales bacterium]|nr:response regulator [Flavobacteriales bacterium]